MDQAKADLINHALVGIKHVSEGTENPEMFAIHQSVLANHFSLRTWIEATDFIDNWNRREAQRAMLANREPNFVSTLKEDVIAAIYTFLSFDKGAILWDGHTLGLGIVVTTPETVN